MNSHAHHVTDIANVVALLSVLLVEMNKGWHPLPGALSASPTLLHLIALLGSSYLRVDLLRLRNLPDNSTFLPMTLRFIMISYFVLLFCKLIKAVELVKGGLIRSTIIRVILSVIQLLLVMTPLIVIVMIHLLAFLDYDRALARSVTA